MSNDEDYRDAAAWYMTLEDNNITEIRIWCKENLTKNSWFIRDIATIGMFEVCVGIGVEAMAFKLRWL